MGCDYYVIQIICVYGANREIFQLEYSRMPRYLGLTTGSGSDSDDEKKYSEILQREIDYINSKPDKILYCNGAWTKESYQTKYGYVLGEIQYSGEIIEIVKETYARPRL